MARKREPGGVEVLAELAEAAPAAGVALAVAGGAVAAYLRWFQQPPIPLAPAFELLGWIAMAGFALLAAKGHLAGRARRRERADQFDRSRTIDDLRRLTPTQFEQVVADAYRRQGFAVDEVGGRADGGVDLVLRSPAGGAHLVQCKRYGERTVGVAEVREFYGAMAHRRTRCEGAFVTCGRFTADATAFAADKPIRLVDGPALVQMLADGRGDGEAVGGVAPQVDTLLPAQPAAAVGTPVAIATRTTPSPVVPPVAMQVVSAGPAPAAVGTPVCPRCRLPMKWRTARKGPTPGRAFWGCANYPRCKHTIDVA